MPISPYYFLLFLFWGEPLFTGGYGAHPAGCPANWLVPKHSSTCTPWLYRHPLLIKDPPK